MGTASHALTLVLIVAADAATQQPPREPAIGEVRDRDGKPFAGATIHLLHRAHPGIVDPELTDALEVTADPRGRFRADVLAGRPYLVWATAPGENGAFRCTTVAEGVVAGVPTVLTESEPRRVRPLQVTVDASWTKPLRFVAGATLGDVAFEQHLGPADAVVATPPWPVDTLTIQVFEDSQLVHREPVALTALGAKTLAAAVTDEERAASLARPANVLVGERTTLLLPVQDKDGTPIADASVQVDDAPFARVLGTTDAAGKLELVAAGEAKAPRATVLDGTHAEFPFDNDNLPAEGKKVEPPDLVAGSVIRGRLLTGENEPLGDVPLILDGSIRNSDNGWWWGVHPRLLASAADGTFVVRGRLQKFPFRLTAVLPPDVLAKLRGDHRTPLWPQVMVVPETADPTKDAGDIRLDRLAAIEVHVAAPDGTPPGSVQVALFPAHEEGDKRWPVRALLARTDRHGRVRVLAPKGTEVAVFAATLAGSAFGFATAGAAPLQRTLDAAQVVRLLVMADDKPLAGAGFRASSPHLEGAKGDAARVKDLLGEPMVHSWCPLLGGVTDAEGRLTIVAPVPGAQLAGFLSIDGKSMHVAIDLREALDDPVRIEFVPGKR
ncbi:MAG: carboxypeptidase regulatory-like domain-containing protein [Planctomycetes bacterium]|nr:carboxypeptidase regulatory-like domain-containing protein [Planctomycetota bacterium]